LDTQSCVVSSQDLKGKIFSSRIRILDANSGYGPSHVWKSIWSARALLKEGLIWRVGTEELLVFYVGNILVDKTLYVTVTF
jgi:hypothetical protein